MTTKKTKDLEKLKRNNASNINIEALRNLELGK